jgi:crotonobetainyl-CoA:carnitine CoA-transferase CaiB-like acyl-CoA transferase
MDATATCAERDPTHPEQPCKPLKGLTVVTLEHAIAAPFATRQLADLGRV